MISKIQIQGVTSYKNQVTLETDKKVNIIYGLNGTGKSSLSNFLYDSSDIKFSECSLDIGAHDNVLVYNQRFIQDHFYESDSLQGIFSLSKENKDIKEKLAKKEVGLLSFLTESGVQQSIIDLEQDRIKSIKDTACDSTWNIKTEYTGGDRVLEFCLEGFKAKKETLFDYMSALPKPESQPNDNINTLKKEVESIQGEAAQAYDLLLKVEFEEHEVEEANIFSDVVIGSENSPVSGLIIKLKNSDWVRQGLDFVDDSKSEEAISCPFCQEETITETLYENIKNYFDESFDDSIEQISNFLTRYQTAAQALQSLDVYKSNPFANEKISFLSEKHRNLEKILQENISLINKKKERPSISVSLVSTRVHVSDFNKLIEEINKEVMRHNEKFENTEREMVGFYKRFWEIMRWNYDQTISAWGLELQASQSIISEASTDKQQLLEAIVVRRQEITSLQKLTVNIDGAIESINNGLVQLGIMDFSIEKYRDTLYKIVRIGSSEADFSSLSEGEKMIISFLYFCELCKGKRSAGEASRNKIAVIDDPISSLSHIFVFNIGQMLKIEFFLSPFFEQVFVLTHSLYFFYELTDTNHDRRHANQKLFRLTKNSEGSDLKVMKYEEIQNDYQSYWAIVNDEHQQPALIANCMRNIIEYFFNFVQKADFSNVLQKPELQEHRYQAFCRYISRESHSLGQNIFDYKEFNYNDFRDGLKQVFEASGYPEHYEKMTKAISA